ncbi:unnamed protein product [Calypogeia fissa]
MNGYYEPDEDPFESLTRTEKLQQNDAYPYRSRTLTLQRQDSSPPKPLASSAVWNVVSVLVQALSDARDELLTLLTGDGVRVPQNCGAAQIGRAHYSSSPTTRSPSRSPCRSPYRTVSTRPLSAPTESTRRSRSPMRRSEDYSVSGRMRNPNPVFLDGGSTTQKSHTLMSPAAYYTSPPVSFGMNLQFDTVKRGRSPPVGCKRPAGRYQPMTLNQRGITTHGLENCLGVPPTFDRRRQCTATRFAELIKAETYQLRERRLAEESVAPLQERKPSWY